MKLLAILCLLLFSAFVMGGYDHGNVVYEMTYSSTKYSRKDVVKDPYLASSQVDVFVRTKFWYYIRNAKLVYYGHIDSSSSFLFFHLYRNHIGSFISVSRYGKYHQDITCATFTRLGDGSMSDQELYSPITLKPFIISANLGKGQYFIRPKYDSHKGKEEFSFDFSDSHALSVTFKKDHKTRDYVSRKCALLERFLYKSFWYYIPIDQTETLGRQISKQTGVAYCNFNFVNYIGTWQAIASWDLEKDEPVVNTFVRLGDGYEKKKPHPVKIMPSPIENKWNFW